MKIINYSQYYFKFQERGRRKLKSLIKIEYYEDLYHEFDFILKFYFVLNSKTLNIYNELI